MILISIHKTGENLYSSNEGTLSDYIHNNKGLLDLQINADHENPCVLMLVNNYNLKCYKKNSINPFLGDQQIALSKDYNPRLGSFSIDSCLISLSKKQPYIMLQLITEV